MVALDIAPRRVRVGRVGRKVAGPVFCVLLLIAWQFAGNAHVSLYLPPLSTAADRAWSMVTGQQLGQDILPSVGRALAGLVIGCVSGLVVGVLVGYGGLHHWVRPALEFLRSLPIVALAPVILITFTPNSTTRIGLIALATFWPVFINAEDGSRSIDPRWIETAMANGHSRSSILFRVVGPGTLPMALAGARISTSISLLAMVVSEWFLATSGLGYRLQYDAQSYDSASMFGAIIVLAVIGSLMGALFSLFEHRVLRWYVDQKGLIS